MLYVPKFNDNNCVVLTNSDTIRVYDVKPTQNSNVAYTDYYINSHYLTNTGTQNFNYYNENIVCRTDITNDFYYRNDISDILIIFMILCIFCILVPLKIFLRLIKRCNW